jgi:hypothetical protein
LPAWFRRERPAQAGAIIVRDAAVRERLALVGLTEDDLGALARWAPACEAAIEEVLDALDRRARQAAAGRAGGGTAGGAVAPEVAAQRRALARGYVLAMLGGVVDDTYVAHRRRAGRLHDAAGLGPDWFAAMYAIVRDGCVRAVRAASPPADELAAFEDALSRLILADLALLVPALVEAREALVPPRMRPTPAAGVSVALALDALRDGAR